MSSAGAALASSRGGAWGRFRVMSPGAKWPESAPTRALARYVTPVLLKVLVALLAVQALDLLLLIFLSRSFGFWQTLAALVVVGLLGSALARRESAKVWRGFQRSMAEARPPEQGILDGMLVLLGGVLLLLPGILSDVLGLALFIPPVRRSLAALLRGRITRDLEVRPPLASHVARRVASGRHEPPPPSSPRVIETTGVESPE